VCAASCGPGNLHLINGLFDANRSRVPVLAIAAHIPEDEIGSEYFQETRPQDLFRECSVYCELVSEPEQIPRVLEIAMRTALARGGAAVVVIPGATRQTLDSLVRVLEPIRRDSTPVIVAVGYRGTILPELRRADFDENGRLATVRRVMERLHPDIILPAEDPFGAGERALGPIPVARWESYLIAAARTAKAIDRKVRIGVSASAYTRNDSALYAWAASTRSPIDILGFSLFPSPYVGGGIQADTRTADRWLRVTPPRKEHWVFATGGYPLAYGERSQEAAVWEVLAWATNHPEIKGAVVYEAGDYGQARGLRAPNGRLRPVTGAVMRALRQLRESAR